MHIMKEQTISLGESHVLVLKEDGSVWAWGDNCEGQLGTGDRKDRFSPVKVMDHVSAVSAGYGCSFAIRDDGSLWGWGAFLPGQSGFNDDFTTSPIWIMDDVQCCDFWKHGTILRKNGTLWKWGNNDEGQLGIGKNPYTEPTEKIWNIPIQILDNVHMVDVTEEYTIALKNDGMVWVNGGTHNVEINGESLYPCKPCPVMNNVVSVSAGLAHTMVLKKDSSVWIWGENYMAQLGIGNVGDVYVPTQLMDNVASIHAGPNYSMVIKKDGSLWGWGNNTFGQLGNGGIGNDIEPVGSPNELKRVHQNIPIKIMEQVADVNTNADHVLALRTDGSLWGWGDNSLGELGSDRKGDKTWRMRVWQTTPIKITEQVSLFEATSDNTVIVKSDGSLWICGGNRHGQIGNGKTWEELAYQSAFIKIMDGIKLPKE